MPDSINMPSIAARKAARKRSLYQSEVTNELVQAAEPSVSAEIVEPSVDSTAAESVLKPALESMAPSIPQELVVPASVRAPMPSDEAVTLSKELLLKLAKQHGLDLSPVKREFTKHTYSITPDRKERMKEYTNVLSLNMQDAICEAFDLFFAQHKDRFDAILRARGNS